LKAYRGRLMRCEGCGLIIDRDEAAALNLRMRGAWGSPERGGATVMMPKGDASMNDYVSRTPIDFRRSSLSRDLKKLNLAPGITFSSSKIILKYLFFDI